MHISQIRFDEEFDKRSPDSKIRYLKRLASTSNQALRIMQEERNKLAAEKVKLTKSLENANSAAEVSAATLVEHITTSNAEAQNYIRQIKELTIRVAQAAIVKARVENAA